MTSCRHCTTPDDPAARSWCCRARMLDEHPPDTPPETTDELRALADRWRREDFTTHGGAAAHEHAGELSALLDAADLVESTDYRVTTTRTDGEQVTFDTRDFQAQFWIDHAGTDGYPPALVECRTVTTVTSRSGWRPVDTGGDQ